MFPFRYRSPALRSAKDSIWAQFALRSVVPVVVTPFPRFAAISDVTTNRISRRNGHRFLGFCELKRKMKTKISENSMFSVGKWLLEDYMLHGQSVVNDKRVGIEFNRSNAKWLRIKCKQSRYCDLTWVYFQFQWPQALTHITNVYQLTEEVGKYWKLLSLPGIRLFFFLVFGAIYHNIAVEIQWPPFCLSNWYSLCVENLHFSFL